MDKNEIRPRLSPGTQWETLIDIVRVLGVDESLKILDSSTSIDILPHFKVNKRITLEELRIKTGTDISNILKGIEALKKSGFNIVENDGSFELSSIITKNPDSRIQIAKNKTFKFGLVSDNHLCSKYERLDILHSLYDYFKEEGITTVFQCGNILDGEARFNKFDLKVHGFDNQIKYTIDNWPKIEGIETLFITGDDHEGWYSQAFGIDSGKRLQQDAINMGRTDIKYLGHMEHDVIIESEGTEIKIRLLHPGGGTGYATSYQPQKIVESYNTGEKPHVLLIGHYHKANYEYIRGIHCIQAGTTMQQSPFMRKKRLAAHLGGWIFEFSVTDEGYISRFKSEFIPFFNKENHQNEWKYEWG